MSIFKILHATLLAFIYISWAGSAFAQSTPIDQNDLAEITEQSPPSKEMQGVYSELEDDHVYGSAVAPVTMIIYASVTCPHCGHWFNTVWPDIKKNYIDKNKLRVVFREFPTSPANIAVIGFQIANCAPENQYLSMIEHQMKEQDNIFASLKAGTGKETYLAIAKTAGLADEAAMNTCIQSQAGYDRINKSMALADAAGIHGVPNFIIDGEKYKGSVDYLPLAKFLDGNLKRGYSPMLK